LIVLLVGGTGFLGGRVARLLAASSSATERRFALVRDPARARSLLELGFELVPGDLRDESSVRAALAGCDTIVTTTTLKLGHAPVLVRAAAETPVRRGIFVSTTGIFTDLELPERTAVLVGEDAIRNSGIAYTILRPTMVYGGVEDINVHRLLRFADRWGFFPVLGRGDCLQQPVHVDDVADAVVAASRSTAAVGRSYNLSGKTPLTFDEMLDAVGQALGRRVRRVPVPYWAAMATAQAFRLLPWRPPFTPGQVRRNNDDKMFDHAPAARDLGFAPVDFRMFFATAVGAFSYVQAHPIGEWN
jgi:uncharacterized protein YbjT (DUF2867 family)